MITDLDGTFLNHHELMNALGNENSLHHKVFSELKKLIAIRRKQSIFCIYNISNESQTLALKDVNLIELDCWIDLVSEKEFENPRETLQLKPYDFLWISN